MRWRLVCDVDVVLDPMPTSASNLDGRTFPGLAIDLHDSRLLMWKRDLALLVEAGVLEMVDESADQWLVSSLHNVGK